MNARFKAFGFVGIMLLAATASFAQHLAGIVE